MKEDTHTLLSLSKSSLKNYFFFFKDFQNKGKEGNKGEDKSMDQYTYMYLSRHIYVSRYILNKKN